MSVIRIVERDGWVQVRQTGSHRQYHHPTKGGTVTIAGAPGVELPPKTLRSVLPTGRHRGAEAVSKYLVIIEEGSTSFGGYVPNLPGCVAVGSTREELTELIREAVALHIDDMRRTGQPVPKPSSAPAFVDAEAV